MWFVSLPVQAAMYEHGSAGPVTWLGVAVWAVGFGFEAVGLVLVACPLYVTNMLIRHTGRRLLEKHMARSKGAAYAGYVRRTSGFIPWPPR